MKKKNKFLILLATLCSLSCIGACSSLQSNVGKPVGNAPEYDWTYAPTMGDPCDEDMVIDGVLDEERWTNQKKLEHTEKGVKTTYTTVFTQKGLYIGAVAEDKEIDWVNRMQYEENSCFWFSVKGADIDVTAMKGTEVFNFYVDGMTASSMNHARYQAKGKTDKPYEENPSVLTAEMFVTWDALNIELGENGELPDFVWINPHYRYVGGIDRDTWLNPLLFFDNNDRQQCSGRFDETGYINADAAGAKIGNAANGHSKSDGWDLTAIDEGIVRSDVDHCQAIFFTDVCSSAYTYTVNVKALNETCNGKWGEIGVVDMVDEVAFHSFFLYQDSLLKRDYSKYGTLSLYGTGFGGWTWLDSGVTMPEYNEDGSVTFTVIKDGAYFYYIVGDELIMSKYVEYLEEDSCPGLFALDSVAEFTAYSATDLSATPEKVDELLAEYGVYRVKKPDVVSGGVVELSTTAVRSGEDVNMTVTPDNGFILTGFTVNGADVYADVVATIDKGKYTLENVTATAEIVPTFTRIPESVRMSGKIYMAGTKKPVLGATATVWGTNPLLYYSNLASANGTYNFYLPKAGTQTIDGRTFNFDGKYQFKARAGGYLSVEDEFEIVADGAIAKDYEMSAPTYDEWNWNVVGEEGVYTPSGTNYYTSSYAYTSKEKSDVVVYSVKINAPLGLTGYRGQLPNVGVTITDGTVLTEQKTNQGASYTQDNELFAARIGLSNCGVVSHTYSIAVNARRIDRPVADRWNFSTLNEAAAYSSSTTERTLTIAIFEDLVYVYVDNVYICYVSLLDSNYFFGDYTFKKDGKYTVGVNTTNVDHVATPITFEVLAEEYGEGAYAMIQSDALFENIRENIKPKTSYSIDYANGVYTAEGQNYYTSAYAYTSENKSETVLYSVKISAPSGLVGYREQLPNVGVTITNGTLIDGATFGGRSIPYGTYYSVQLGLSHVGIVSQLATCGSMARRIDALEGDRWNFTAVNANYAFTDNVTERTLTIALYQDVLYIFVDGVYATRISLLNANYFSAAGYAFEVGQKYTFGVNATNIDHSVNPVTLEVLTEKYGTEAMTELTTNDLYLNEIFKVRSNSIVTNSDGSYTLGTGWMKYSYVYTTKTPTDTAVYSVKFTNSSDMYGESWCGHTGIIFSNGEVMGANTWTDANKASSGRVGNEYFLSGVVIGFNGQSAANSNKYLSLTSGILSAWNERYYNLNTTVAFTEKTLTLVLYKGSFYVYVDGVYTTTVSLDNAAFDYTNNDGETKNITSSDKLIFGVAAVNAKTSSTATVLQQLTGNDALEYIKANYSANITVQ